MVLFILPAYNIAVQSVSLTGGVVSQGDLETFVVTARFDWCCRPEFVDIPPLAQEGRHVLNLTAGDEIADATWVVIAGVKKVSKTICQIASFYDHGVGVSEALFGSLGDRSLTGRATS